jgi:SAM-dependent methyltransferase
MDVTRQKRHLRDMLNRIRASLNRTKTTTAPAAGFHLEKTKYASELAYWENEVTRIVQWYKGDSSELCGIGAPSDSEKVHVHKQEHSAILTWQKMCGESKYLHDLRLEYGSFKEKRVLDLGSGPVSGATAFHAADLYCLDPLLPYYIQCGFPIHYYEAKFVYSCAEQTPFPNDYFDAIVAVNSIDHVDDFEAVASEMNRILKPNGRLAIHAHYHKAVECEPVELSDARMEKAFAWCPGMKMVHSSNAKLGHTLNCENEMYALWRNF